MLKHFITVSSQKNLDNSFDKFDVLSVSGKYGIVNQIKFQGRSFAGKTLTNYKVVNTNDVVYTKSPIKNNPYGVIKVNKHKSGIVSTLYAVYNPTKYVCSNFVELYFNDNLRLNKYLKPIVNIGAKHDMKIANKEVINHNVIFPEVEEQRQICTFFLKLEKLISLQQRKAQQLKLLKKAMLQDIFPNTQGIRQIKLSNNIWVEKRMVDIFKEKNIRSKNGELLSVSISKGIYPFSNSERKNNSSIDKSNYKKVTPGDITYNSMRMWQGALGVSKYNGIVSPAYTVMATKEKENPLFYYYYFKNTRMMFNFRQHSQGLTSDTWNLKFPLLKKIAIQIPINKNEEEKIIKLFESIDIAITSIELKIEKLKAVKQFLLQNMFI
ncbi:restriction endonuclease subunit S [Lactobacillus crispatus]|nr:restriction endonuclease subunit S [Lactobacillus crispatus]